MTLIRMSVMGWRVGDLLAVHDGRSHGSEDLSRTDPYFVGLDGRNCEDYLIVKVRSIVSQMCGDEEGQYLCDQCMPDA
jgi:hypothetical protein